MRYVKARYNNYVREMTYRIYISDVFHARYQLNVRYRDVVSNSAPLTEQDAAGVVDDVIKNAGLEVV